LLLELCLVRFRVILKQYSFYLGAELVKEL
jgi:hypothetical protein